MNEFPNGSLKKIRNDFDKIGLLSLTVSESEGRSLLATVQLDFSWTLDMPDQQIDRFARAIGSLSNSFSTMCTS